MPGRNDPYGAFNFLVEIAGVTKGGFMEVTGLDAEVNDGIVVTLALKIIP